MIFPGFVGAAGLKHDVEKRPVNIHLLKVCAISGGGSKMAAVAVAQQ